MKSQRKLHNWWLWCQDLAVSSCWEWWQWEGGCCRSQQDLVLPPKRSPAWALGTQGPLGQGAPSPPGLVPEEGTVGVVARSP